MFVQCTCFVHYYYFVLYFNANLKLHKQARCHLLADIVQPLNWLLFVLVLKNSLGHSWSKACNSFVMYLELYNF